MCAHVRQRLPENEDCVSGTPTFQPMSWSMKELRDAIPPHLFVRDTKRSLSYLARDLALSALMLCWGSCIDVLLSKNGAFPAHTTFLVVTVIRWALWCLYWWFQGLIFTGLWVIGHECGHGAFSPNKHLCDVIGFTLHSLLWTPYFSWKISHHRHHRNHASMERDEVYVPKTRSDLDIPNKPRDEINWEEVFGDTPIYTFYMLVQQQLLAFPAYLLWNVSGQKTYPKWTNHFSPRSILFTRDQARAVWVSNLGLLCTAFIIHSAVCLWGLGTVVKLYGVPWLLVTHWFIMITFLQHTDPILPHYRGKTWNFQRGAAATADRNFLGWQGRFFLHDVAHFHVVHHFFPKMPFYNGMEATKHLKALLGNQYVYSGQPVFKALWANYNNCQFVEDDGEVLFYHDKWGKVAQRVELSAPSESTLYKSIVATSVFG